MSFTYQGAAGGLAASGVGGRFVAGGVGGVGGVGGGFAAGGASGRVVAGGVGAMGGAGVYPGSGGVAVGGVGGGIVAGGGGACATAEDCTAACVCAGERPPAVMTYVGWGDGNYITETNYKYVGYGRGDLAMVSQPRYIWGRVAVAITSLALLLILLILLWPHHVFTTTTIVPHWTTTPPPHHGECTFWGDPHMKTFDGSRPSFYGEGEAWVIKTSTVKIQARYKGTKYTKGLAATNKVAASANGHVIIVGTMESGDFTVDGQSVLTTFGTYTVAGVGKITYNSAGNLVDAAAGVWAKHVVHIELPSGIRLTVFRWNNYLDLRITGPAIPGMDGACGNFNGNAADDTTAAIQARVGSRVGPGDLLFSRRTEVHFTATEQQLIASCAPATYSKAQQDCQAQQRGPHIHNQLKSCLLDRCWGSNEHTLRYAKGLGW